MYAIRSYYGEDIKEVIVFNSVGQKIISKENCGMSTEIYLYNYNAGVYIVKVITENGSEIKKIIKQ